MQPSATHLDLLRSPRFSTSPNSLDLTSQADLDQVTLLADQLLTSGGDAESFAALEIHQTASSSAAPLPVHLAIKLARSRASLLSLEKPHRVSVLFAVYKEHQRILPSGEHENGEDFLRRKLAQMRWLFNDTPHRWDLTVVDDGCPEGSGTKAKEIIAAENAQAQARVLFLADAIENEHPAVGALSATNQSQKGGSILLGMAEAAANPNPEPLVVVFTDADLSTHLGQVGLLVHNIARGGADAAIGSRRETESVVVKKGQRNTRGKLFIFLWKQLLEPLGYITDTQCGFKAFRGEIVKDIVAGNIESKFAFDLELLLKTELRRRGSIQKTPIAWIDSEAESTTTDLEPYLPMLKSAAAIYRRYLPANDRADSFAAFIDDLHDTAWNDLVDNMPEAIADADPAEFGPRTGVSLEDLQR